MINITKQDAEKILKRSSEQFLKGNFRSAEILMSEFLEALPIFYSIKGVSGKRKAKKLSPQVSIIVVTYLHSDDFLELVSQLKPYADNKEYEVIFVTNDNETSAGLIPKFISNYKLVEIDINVGASIARNLGAEIALGHDLVFLDDDGSLDEGGIEALVKCKRENNAVCVRGKIKTKTPQSIQPSHYDRGSAVIPSISDIEGFVVWDKEAFLNVGGFAPLLWGHEGIHLMLKAFRFHSPIDFLYCPDAIFYHDFDQNPVKTKNKIDRHNFNSKYIRYDGYSVGNCIDRIKDYASNLFLSEIFNFKEHFFSKYLPHNGNELISIITTAKNAEEFIEDYTASLKNQTYQTFEIIFVDDGSKDQTLSKIKQLWKGDARLKVLELRKNNGRSNALNRAISMAKGQIYLIHDVDDVSNPHRFELTASYFDHHKDAKCLSFYMYNEQENYLVSRPFVSKITSIQARRLLGMPVGFTTFACRRSFARHDFDPTLKAGVDCDWLHRNLDAEESDGAFIPLPMVYYRRHEKQITSQKHGLQNSVAEKCLLDHHRKYIGDNVSNFAQTIKKSANLAPLSSGGDVNEIRKYYVFLKNMISKIESKEIADVYLSYLDYAHHEIAVSRLTDDYAKLSRAHDLVLNPKNKPSWKIREYVFFLPVLPFVKALAKPEHIDLYREKPGNLFVRLKDNKYKFVGRHLFGVKYY